MLARRLEDGLISPDKVWVGTRRFGMVYADPSSKGVASVGTVLEITEHSRMEDGRCVG